MRSATVHQKITIFCENVHVLCRYLLLLVELDTFIIEFIIWKKPYKISAFLCILPNGCQGLDKYSDMRFDLVLTEKDMAFGNTLGKTKKLNINELIRHEKGRGLLMPSVEVSRS